MSNFNRLKIAGIGKYLPTRVVLSSELDERIGKNAGWVEANYGIAKRHFAAASETTSFMAVQAAKEALLDSKIKAEDIDCIISACAVMEQPLPGTGPLVQKKLMLGKSGCTTLDVNSSCLSFLSALDIAHLYISTSKYRNILIVSSDIASIGLNWDEPDICTNFGDGAAAVVVCASQTGGILGSRFETFSEGYDHCQIRAGGTLLYESCVTGNIGSNALFAMNGKAVFKLTNKVISPFIAALLASVNLTWKEINVIIPHQASSAALALMRKKFAIAEEKFIEIFSTHGNQIAASLPTTLYEAIKSQRLKRGDKAMLIGTAAGLSLGGMILEY